MAIQQSYRATRKVTPPILLCQPVTSEADVGGMAVEAETSHQYSITFCCCMTGGSGGAIWQNDIWHGSACEAKGCHWILPWGRNGIHRHSLTLTECLQRPNSECEHREVMGGAFQRWQRWQQVTPTGADIYECSMQALVHCWWTCIASGGDYAEK